MENNIYFKESFVKKMLKLVPENLKKVWGFENTDFSKIVGGVRYDNNNLESIYLGEIVRYLDVDYETFVKFNYINGKFIFDSMYFQYDPITKEDIYPYEKRYDKDFNVARNCTTVAIPEFERFELTAYYLYRLTFGNSLNEVLYHNFPLTDIVLLYLPIYILTDFSQLYVFCLGHDEFNR